MAKAERVSGQPKNLKSKDISVKKTAVAHEIYFLLISVMLLTSVGLVMTFSASFPFSAQEYSSPTRLFLKQLLALSLAIVACLVAYAFTSRISIRKMWFPVWMVTIFLVGLTFVPGISEEAKGAARWIRLGFFNLQPSEFLKIAVIIAVAHLGHHYAKTRKKAFLYLAIGVVIVSSLAVLMQKDMTTAAIVYFSGTVAMFFTPVLISEMWVLFAAAIIGGVVGVLLERYRFQRLMIFLDPWKDLDAGRQVIVSLLALAKGGVRGVGIGKSIFKYNILPEAHTDFIFAIIGSELGLIGSLAVIGLLMLAVISGFRLSNKMKDPFSRSVSLSLISMIAFQSLINIGGTVKALPPTGVPLPYVSFGGSSLIASYIVIGIICGLYVRGLRHDKNIRSWRRD